MFDWRLILANMPHWHHDRTQSLHDAMQISLTPPADMYPIVPDKVNLKISSHRISALHQFIIIFIKVAIWGVTYPVFRHDMSPKLPKFLGVGWSWLGYCWDPSSSFFLARLLVLVAFLIPICFGYVHLEHSCLSNAKVLAQSPSEIRGFVA